MQNARESLTTCVRGTTSAIYAKVLGRFSNGKNTPEKKNIGDKRPVK
jgi:hypothetical protein